MLKESDLIRNWHYKLALLTGIIIPSVTATGAYFDLKSKLQETQNSNQERISKLELQSEKQFADKSDLKQMQSDMSQMRDDIVEIKTILHKKLR